MLNEGAMVRELIWFPMLKAKLGVPVEPPELELEPDEDEDGLVQATREATTSTATPTKGKLENFIGKTP
jgi:hypothetical protein